MERGSNGYFVNGQVCRQLVAYLFVLVWSFSLTVARFAWDEDGTYLTIDLASKEQGKSMGNKTIEPLHFWRNMSSYPCICL